VRRLQHLNQVTERIDRERSLHGPATFAPRMQALLAQPGRQALATFRVGYPVRLLTVALSLFAVACAVRLWYIPGPLLLGAAGLAVVAGPAGDVAAAVRRDWLRVLVSVLGGYYLVLAGGTSGTRAALGALGGFAVFAAPWVARRSPRWALVLLVCGALPFAVATWWSVVTPVVAILAIGLGVPVLAASRSHPRTARLIDPRRE